MPYGESLSEIAADRGSIESNGCKTPIGEIDIELICGQFSDIFGLTRQPQETIDLRPAIASKAERRYAIFAGSPARPFRAKPGVWLRGIANRNRPNAIVCASASRRTG